MKKRGIFIIFLIISAEYKKNILTSHSTKYFRFVIDIHFVRLVTQRNISEILICLPQKMFHSISCNILRIGHHIKHNFFLYDLCNITGFTKGYAFFKVFQNSS